GASLRPRARAALHGRALPARAGGARAVLDGAPRGVGRLVLRRVPARAGRALWSFLTGEALPAAAAADPLSGFRGVASPLAAGAGARRAGQLLAGAAEGAAADPRHADGSAAPGAHHLRWRDGALPADEGRDGRAGGPRAPRRRDGVHGAPR